jgi:hypothetical protein
MIRTFGGRLRRSPFGRVRSLLSSRTLQTGVVSPGIARERDWDVPVEVLNPLGVDVAVKDDPVTLRALRTHVVHNLAEDVREESIVPLAGRRVERPVQRLLRDGLGIDHVRDAFGTRETLECGEEDAPGGRLSRRGGTDHHQSVLDVLDLVELDDLLKPSLVGDEVLLGADGDDVLLELVEVDGDVVDPREDVGEEAMGMSLVRTIRRISDGRELTS